MYNRNNNGGGHNGRNPNYNNSQGWRGPSQPNNRYNSYRNSYNNYNYYPPSDGTYNNNYCHNPNTNYNAPIQSAPLPANNVSTYNSNRSNKTITATNNIESKRDSETTDEDLEELKRKQRQEKLAAWRLKKNKHIESNVSKPSLMKFNKKKSVLINKTKLITKVLSKSALDLEDDHDIKVRPESKTDVEVDLDSLIENIESKEKILKNDKTAEIIDNETDIDKIEEIDDNNIITPDQLLKNFNEKNKKDIPKHEFSNQPFERKFYQESEFIKKLTLKEVASLRLREGITIRGKGILKPILDWSQLGLPYLIYSVVEEMKFDSPSPIQCEALPHIMNGADFIGIAKTGSGKTLAFLLPMFRQILSNEKTEEYNYNGSTPRALIMSPTRELAMQIYRQCLPLLEKLGLRGCCAYGGQPISQNIAELKKNCDVLVGTPGRIIDLLCSNGGRILNFSCVSYLVLDEADRMFDMGFEPQVLKIINATRPDRQTVLFSATFPPKIESLAKKILTNPIEVSIGSKNLVNDKIDQKFEVLVDNDTKFNKLLNILGNFKSKDKDGKVLIFMDRQDSCDKMVKKLISRGYATLSLHGGKDQIERDGTIQDFKSGIMDILIATSVASRGLDVENLNLVINYDAPSHIEDYVHRVGRTGRAGKNGEAITFITPDQEKYASDIAKILKLSGLDIPQKILQMSEDFQSKLKDGNVKFSSGFSGKGLEKLQAIREEHMNMEKKLYLNNENSNKVNNSNNGIGNEDGDADNESTDISDSNVNQEELELLADFKVVYGSASSGPDSSMYHAKLNINDLPQKTRWYVSNGDNIAKIVDMTSTSITSKGRFYPPGYKLKDEDDAKLYLLVEGETELNVRRAVELFKESLVNGLVKAQQEDRGKKYSIV